MKKSKQISLFQPTAKPQKFFGGALLQGRRKSMRPLSSKDSIYFVLRCTWATGADSFLAKRNFHSIDRIVKIFAKRFGIRIYKRSINSNHLHLLLRITNRRLYKAFIKAVSGQIASHVMQQKSFNAFAKSRLKLKAGDGSKVLNEVQQSANKKESVVGKLSGFWEFRPFSRVVNWGRDFNNCVNYLKQNFLEAFGFAKYTPRKDYYALGSSKAKPELNTS